MLEGLFSGLQDANQPSLQDQWSQALRRPEIQAGLLNFGIELMKPRWTAGSALPDALAAGARGYAGVQEEEYNRQRQDEQIARSQEEKSADRSNRMEIAKLNADSRAEVQGLRNEAMLRGIETRHQLKIPPQGQAELKIYQDALKAARAEFKTLNESSTLLGTPSISDADIEARAAARAQDAVTRYRLNANPSGGGSVPEAGMPPNTSTNSAKPSGQQGEARPSDAAKNTSKNTQSAPPTSGKKSFAEFKAYLESTGRWTPALEANLDQIKPYVSDPDAVDGYKTLKRAPARGGTDAAIRKMY